ncbi:hypothetical protein GCM10009612_17470 [Streptomyces beijiangensis]
MCVTALAEQVVHSRDGGPAGVQGGGELALGGEADVEGDASVEDERAHRLGEVAVGGARLGGVGQHRGQLTAAEGPIHTTLQ